MEESLATVQKLQQRVKYFFIDGVMYQDKSHDDLLSVMTSTFIEIKRIM